MKTLLLLLLLATPAAAQVRSAALVSENDAYNFWIPYATRPDEEYSNGVELALVVEGAPLLGRLARADSAAGRATDVRVGHRIFTPREEARELLPGQRPFAGWLYLSASVSVEGERVRRTAGVEAGVTGPPSRGEWVQTSFHRIAGFREVRGWDGQLRTEPGVVVRYGEERVLAAVAPGGVRVAEAVPHWGAALGNVLTGAHAGVRLRAGYAVPRPWGRTPRRGPLSLFASAAVRGDWVARDLFLDGNTFRDGPRVERIPGVAEGRAGLGVRIGPVGIEYQAVHRTRSYRTEPRGHTRGMIAVTVR